MEDADLATEIVLRLFPEYTPYERRVNRDRDEFSGMVEPMRTPFAKSMIPGKPQSAAAITSSHFLLIFIDAFLKK